MLSKTTYKKEKMKLTKSKLQRLIQEELGHIIEEGDFTRRDRILDGGEVEQMLSRLEGAEMLDDVISPIEPYLEREDLIRFTYGESTKEELFNDIKHSLEKEDLLKLIYMIPEDELQDVFQGLGELTSKQKEQWRKQNPPGLEE